MTQRAASWTTLFMGLLLSVGVLAPLLQGPAPRILSRLHRLPSLPHELAEEICRFFLASSSCLHLLCLSRLLPPPGLSTDCYVPCLDLSSPWKGCELVLGYLRARQRFQCFNNIADLTLLEAGARQDGCHRHLVSAMGSVHLISEEGIADRCSR